MVGTLKIFLISIIRSFFLLFNGLIFQYRSFSFEHLRSLKRDIASTIHIPFVPWRAFPCSRFGSRCVDSHRNPAHVSGTYPAGIIERAIPFRNDQRKQKVLLTRNMISRRATVCRAVRRGLPLYARVLSETIHRFVTRRMSVMLSACNRRISRRLHFILIVDIKCRAPIYAQ